MDRLKHKVNTIKEDLTSAITKLKDDVKQYEDIHLVYHEEGPADNCANRVRWSTDQAEYLYSSLEEVLEELTETMVNTWEGSEEDFHDTIIKQYEDLQEHYVNMQMIVRASRETLEIKPTPKENHEASTKVLEAENKCKYCKFIVEGKLKPSKIYQKKRKSYKFLVDRIKISQHILWDPLVLIAWS